MIKDTYELDGWVKRLQADQISCLTPKCRGWKAWWVTKMHCTGGDVRKVSLDHLETSLGRRWCDPLLRVVGDNNATLCALQL